ncbi:TetR/AcrR family transcriptional regulator [Bradyrhizobium tropiciagri]|uniref:TetR/AcrR family transcriptional regulator n=1 Tax=Bradyrhizobium tropiciagri TaxID=312253 RepID=UPI001BA7EF7F|nr:TetR/AcrR family transcriptional regulator [Bradyrhizobium tropiciagri]MBR0872956.1 TetR/AcrR family transcriptional regulator [Bradyrhizobium tropiciagri]
MTRKIAFDYDRAVDKATRLFWKKGYTETGLRDLLKVMQIGEGSFYNTLKSKKQLYLACLQRYEETVVETRLQALAAAPTAAEGIRAFFRAVLDRLDIPSTPSRLCMLAAMASEDVLVEASLRTRARTSLEALEQLFGERLNQDRDNGALPRSLDPSTTAQVIVTYLQGLWRRAVVDYDRSRFERQIDAFLTALGL